MRATKDSTATFKLIRGLLKDLIVKIKDAKKTLNDLCYPLQLSSKSSKNIKYTSGFVKLEQEKTYHQLIEQTSHCNTLFDLAAMLANFEDMKRSHLKNTWLLTRECPPNAKELLKLEFLTTAIAQFDM